MPEPKVTADISVSLDGFVAGPNDDVDRLHQWLYGLSSWREPHGLEGGERSRDSEVLDEAFRNVGAVVMGRRMFDLVPDAWGDEPPFHAPVFVLTHRAHEPLPKDGGTTFTFVTEGVESALQQARTAAADKDVSIAGGASAIQQFISAGLLDEMQIHVVPVLLGEGIPLFANLGTGPLELERTRVIESPDVLHMKFRLPRG